MIISEIFYGLKCDRCGEVYEDGEHSFWNDESSSIENAMESEWIEQKGKNYCPNCHGIDSETDVTIVYDEFPAHLKILNKFIDKVVGGISREVFEDFFSSEFTVKCSFYSRRKPKLEIFEENYIKKLIGEKFISLEYENGKHNSATCIIKFKK